MGSASRCEIRNSLLKVLDERDHTGLAAIVSEHEDVAAICVDEIRTTAVLTHRNVLALALSDSRIPGAAEAILAALDRHEFDDQTGTLLHALNGLDGTLPAKMAVRLIERGSYETHMELVDLFEGERISYTKQFGRADMVRSLEALAHSEVEETARATVEIMEIMTDQE